MQHSPPIKRTLLSDWYVANRLRHQQYKDGFTQRHGSQLVRMSEREGGQHHASGLQQMGTLAVPKQEAAGRVGLVVIRMDAVLKDALGVSDSKQWLGTYGAELQRLVGSDYTLFNLPEPAKMQSIAEGAP